MTSIVLPDTKRLMDVYLAGSIAGGRDFADDIKLIAKTAEKLGHTILTPFVVDASINAKRFPDLSGVEKSRAKYDEDMTLLNKCTVAVAEVSQPSLGVGIELGQLMTMDKPVLCLRHKKLEDKKMSSLVEGNPHFVFKHYDKDTIREVLQDFFDKAL